MQAVVIGIKTYKVSLKLTMTTSDGESFEQDIDIVIDADSREEAKRRLQGLRASVQIEDVRITSIHHVGREVKPFQPKSQK
ncbi:MAG TPA: hypothetical protein DG761_09810 [Gammaproteobacteria bacterium]|nr:hypothetical protein [Acidiferrobacteraceae bacterium]HCX88309.1 hypothetical protein [Gammaproteobacteria bacterium]